MNKENPPIYSIVFAFRDLNFRHKFQTTIQDIDWLAVMGESSKGFELLKLIKNKKPDMAIIDIFLPKVRGIELTRAIKIKNPLVKVLIYSYSDSTEYIRKAFSSGADGYLLIKDYKTELKRPLRRSGGERLTYRLAFLFKWKTLKDINF